jgi:hypothetical protein
LGVVTTGNSLDHTERDDQEMLANGMYAHLEASGDAGVRYRFIIFMSLTPGAYSICPECMNMHNAFGKRFSTTCNSDCAPVDASVKDMEGAAVAWTAELFGVPTFALKVV